MAGVLPGGVSPDAVLGQAQQIWTMLDELATSNPDAYQKFIKKQLKEGQEAMKPPAPHMCIQTIIYDSGQQDVKLFINVFEWNRIPNAKDDESPIPVMGGPLYSGEDEHGCHKLVCVAFNPDILNRFGLHSKLVEERKMLIELAISYLEDQHKLKISRHYTLLNKDILCKGSNKAAVQSLMKKQGKEDKEFQQQLSELEETFGPDAHGCKDSLLSKISGIAVSTTDQCDEFISEDATLDNQNKIRMPGEKSHIKKPLVEELSKEDDSHLPEPVYDLIAKEINGQQLLVAKVRLPGVTSVQQCELNISEDDVQLTVSDEYKLDLSLPHKIDCESVSARFSRRSSTLTLSLPLLPVDGR